YAELKEFEKASLDFSKYIELEPKDSNGFYLRGLSYEELGKKDIAKKDYIKACEMGNQESCIAKDSEDNKGKNPNKDETSNDSISISQ
ncbi:MAG: hypothetical protein ACK4IX_06695, partial [Candidatus Sericytochromatia bacterium]